MIPRPANKVRRPAEPFAPAAAPLRPPPTISSNAPSGANAPRMAARIAAMVRPIGRAPVMAATAGGAAGAAQLATGGAGGAIGSDGGAIGSAGWLGSVGSMGRTPLSAGRDSLRPAATVPSGPGPG